MTALSQQMHAKMTMCLDELRKKTMARMGEAGERIKKRPQLKGDDSLSQIKGHSVMQKDDAGATFLGFAMGVPGMDGMMETAVDVGMELYGDRKAVHARPQDDQDYTPKQEATIRDQNKQDLALFNSLDDKLNTLNTYIAMGYTLGLDWNGELIPWEEVETPKYNMKIDPVEEMKMRAEGLDLIPMAHRPKPATMGMGV